MLFSTSGLRVIRSHFVTRELFALLGCKSLQHPHAAFLFVDRVGKALAVGRQRKANPRIQGRAWSQAIVHLFDVTKLSRPDVERKQPQLAAVIADAESFVTS